MKFGQISKGILNLWRLKVKFFDVFCKISNSFEETIKRFCEKYKDMFRKF